MPASFNRLKKGIKLPLRGPRHGITPQHRLPWPECQIRGELRRDLERPERLGLCFRRDPHAVRDRDGQTVLA